MRSSSGESLPFNTQSDVKLVERARKLSSLDFFDIICRSKPSREGCVRCRRSIIAAPRNGPMRLLEQGRQNGCGGDTRARSVVGERREAMESACAALLVRVRGRGRGANGYHVAGFVLLRGDFRRMSGRVARF